MNIIPLGTCGWVPTSKRDTSSFLLEVENKLIFLDAGTGLHKLGNHINVFNDYDEINIILSHYHLDHIIGLSYLPLWFKDKIITIWGPGKSYYSKGCDEILTDFTTSPYFASSIKEFAKEVYLKDYDENGFMIDNLRISINKQVHSSPSFGITIGNYLHYATDTNILRKSFDNNCKLILHECWTYYKKDAEEHSSLEEIREMVEKYNIKKIGLIHINPRYNEEELREFNDDRIFIVEEDNGIIL